MARYHHMRVSDATIYRVLKRHGVNRLPGKVERSHQSDQEEFYQLLNYKNDVDLKKKLTEWEQFYNLARPHGAHRGKTPYESLRKS